LIKKEDKSNMINMILLIAGLICIITGIIIDFRLLRIGGLKDIHIWAGYIMAMGMIIHVVYHKMWITNMLRRVGISKKE